jgi:hypothetical protein
MTDLERMGLKGDIKTYSHIEYRPIKNIADTSSLRVDHFFLSPNNYTLHFNNEGYKTKMTEYEYLYEEDSLKPKGIWTYSYDSINRIVQEIYYLNNISNDTTILNYEYIGDSVTLVHDTNKNLTYRYAQRGKIEFATKANSDSSHISRQLFVYDKLNRLIRKEEYEDRSTLTFLRSWNYTDSLSTKPSLDVGISAKYNYGPIIMINEYDSLQNLVLSKGIGSQKPKIIEYTYDSNGNWIEQRTQQPNDLIKISRRKIEYFKE